MATTECRVRDRLESQRTYEQLAQRFDVAGFIARRKVDYLVWKSSCHRPTERLSLD